MDCESFEQRKQELESECKVRVDFFERVSKRLSGFMEPFVRCFRTKTQRCHAETIVSGLCSDLERKNGESIAYHFGLDRKAMQHFIGESPWEDAPVREELAGQIGKELGEPDAVLVFDPSGFPKSGKQSVGVARQWCGRIGKVDNCQVAVYLAYVSSKGHALVDEQLYLPKEWTEDKQRMQKAGVPKDRQRYCTRHELCLKLLEQHGAQLPHAWITGDDEMGRPAGFRRELRSRGEQYILAVPCNTTIRDLEIPAPEYSGAGRPSKRPSVRVDRWKEGLRDEDWTQIAVRDGEKGPIVVEAVKRHVETGKRGRPSVSEEMLVIVRYRDRDNSAVVKTDYYLSNAPQETTLNEFCRVVKAEHRIEECIQRGKGEAGLADYEVRNWVGWQHHQTLSLLASWFLNVETRRAEKKDTCDDVQPTAFRNRRSPSTRVRMRFTPTRKTPNRTKIAT